MVEPLLVIYLFSILHNVFTKKDSFLDSKRWDYMYMVKDLSKTISMSKWTIPLLGIQVTMLCGCTRNL